VNAAKIGILTLVLGTPFGLAVYSDFVASSSSSRAHDGLQDQVDELNDQLNTERAEAAERMRAQAAQEQLVARLGDHPSVVAAAAVRGIDGVEVTDGLMVDGKGKYDAGTFVELADPDGSLRSRLAARWGDPIARTDSFEQPRWFWFDEAAAVRVMLVEGGLDDRTALELRPYTPLEPLVNEAAGYVGQQVSALPVADTTTSPIWMVRPPSEYSDAATRLQLWTEHGTVTRVVIFADVIYDPSFVYELAMKRLARDRGEPTTGPTDNVTRYDFPGRPPLRIDVDSGDAMTILLGPPEPTRP